MARFPRRRPGQAEPGSSPPWRRRQQRAIREREEFEAEAPVDPRGGRRIPAKALLPNAFTTAALFSGFYAIVQAMNLQFDTAVYAVFAAMVLDSLDGRVARMTNTQSEFGAEYDSLADMVSFGAAPALIMYEWSLRGLGRWGWAAAFIYVAGAALRLARFNTNIAIVDKRFFQGIPSPAAAALVVGFVWVFDDLRYLGADLKWPSWIVTVYAGLTMVSNSPFFSFKVFDVKKSVPAIVLVLVVLAFAFVSSDPPKWLFGLFMVYGVSGHALWLWRRAHHRAASPIRRAE
jgi:CDP-diacylglycerol--serine O-phosphatidyltransferase